MTPPRAYLVDVYRTLVEVDFARHAAELLPLAGLPPDVWGEHFSPLADEVNVGRLTLRDAFAAALANAGVEPTSDLLTAMVERDKVLFDEHTHVYSDSLPFLELLHAEGIPTAIVSNCAENTRRMLDRVGITDLVDVLVLSCEVGRAKPEPGIYLDALDALGVPPVDAVLVDDQPAYCAGALAVGARAVRIAREGAPWFDHGLDPGVPVVHSLTEITPLLHDA